VSLQKKVLSGSLWSLAISWFNRTIGLISTLILLRILEPSDFGIVALATMVMLLFMSLCELGIREYIIKTADISDDMVNSAWTLQILINVIISLMLLATAPFVASMLENEKLTEILRVIAFIPFIAALTNPGVTLLNKQMKYARTSKISIAAKLITAPLTIYIAVVHESYWALIWGNIASVALVFVLSYVFVSYRPKLRFSDFKIIFSETKWLVIGTFTSFIRAKTENFIINSKFGAEGVGLYSTSIEFAHLPFTDIISPASKPLLAGVSSIRTGLVDAYKAILKYLHIALFFIIPTIVGIFIVGDLFVEVVMGPQWNKAIITFKIVSILMIVYPLYNCCRIIMFLSNDLKILTTMDVISICVMIAVLLPSYVESLETLAWGRVVIGLGFSLALITTLHLRYKLEIKPIFTLFTAVLLLCIPFGASIYVLKPMLLSYGLAVTLIITGIIGCIIYLATVLLSMQTLAQHNEYFLFTKEFIEGNVSSIKRKCANLMAKS
jgi:O-antigen/teichoic acid export membrane protein